MATWTEGIQDWIPCSFESILFCYYEIPGIIESFVVFIFWFASFSYGARRDRPPYWCRFEQASVEKGRWRLQRNDTFRLVGQPGLFIFYWIFIVIPGSCGNWFKIPRITVQIYQEPSLEQAWNRAYSINRWPLIAWFITNFAKIIKISRVRFSRVNITRPCCFSPLWGTQEPRTGSCVFIVHGLPRIRTLEIPLTSGFATGFATPGRMYIPAFSIWTYSDVGLKCIRSWHFFSIISGKGVEY